MFLHGYVDDSGSGEGKDRGDIFVLAGFLSSAPRWEQFSDRWRKICSQNPRTPDFKMYRDVRLKRDDGTIRWTKAQRDKRIQKLVSLIKRKSQYRVESLVAWPNYDLVVRGKVPPEIDNPYFLLFFSIILSVASFMNKANIEGTVDWTFDVQGPIIEKECARWYGWIREQVGSDIKRRLGSTPCFKDDTTFLPLKAADIYAWQIRRHLDKEQSQGIPHNDYIDSLLGIHGVSNVIEGEHLEDFVANVRRGDLVLRSRTKYFLPPKSRFQRIVNYVRKRFA